MHIPDIRAFVAIALTSGLGAQTCFYLPSDTPATGAVDVQPFGNVDPSDPNVANQRYQIQIPSSVFGNQPRRICEVYVAPAGSRRRQFTELFVRFGHNPGSLGTSMAANMTGFTSNLVFTNGIQRETVADTWWPLGLTGTFDFDPTFGELVLEIFVRDGGAPTGTGDPGFRTDPSIPYVVSRGPSFRGTVMPGGGLKVRFCTDASELIEYGGGACAGSNGLTPRLTLSGSAQVGGPGLQVGLRDAVVRPNTAAALFWSFEVRSGAIDLSPIGMTGCGLYLRPQIVTLQTTSTGQATVSAPLRVGIAACTKVWMQWFLLDPGANSLGVVGTNFGAATIGR